MGVNRDPGYGRTTDADTALGSTLGQMSLWFQVTSRAPHQPTPHCLYFFRSGFLHCTRTILLLLLTHFSTVYLLSIVALTQLVWEGARWSLGCLPANLGLKGPGWPVGG